MPLAPAPNNFFFVPKDFSDEEEYQAGWSISDAFSVWQNGLKTDRDELFFGFEKSDRPTDAPVLRAEARIAIS